MRVVVNGGRALDFRTKETAVNVQSPTPSSAEEMVGKNGRVSVDAWFTPLRFALFLIFVIVARFPRVVLGQETFFHRDYGLFTYPIAHYIRQCFWRGEVPLWDPFNNFGIPFLAQWNTSVLYPPSIFFLVLPLTWSLALLNLGHLVFAGLGMYFLARRWTGSQMAASLAGTAFTFNGLSLHMVMWISNLAAWAWMPWVVLLVEKAWDSNANGKSARRAVVLAGIAGAMQMLAGAPEIILLTWIFLAAIWLARFWRGTISRANLFWRTTGVCALVAGLSAAQLLPFMQLLSHSQRDASFSDSKWAMPGWGWANFFVPLFHCSPSILGIYSQDAQQWTSSYYMGIGVLALGVLAFWQKDLRARWLAVAAIAGIILSMGGNTPVYAGIRRLFPFIGVMRYPIKIAVLTTFALPLLAAGCFSLKTNDSLANPQKIGRRFVMVGIIFVMVIAGILIFARHFPAENESWAVTCMSGLSRALFLALILGAAWMNYRAQSARTAGLAGAMILLLVTVDALTHTPNQNPALPNVIYAPLGNPQLSEVHLGAARAEVNPRLNLFLTFAETPDAMNYYLGVRRALFLNCNLIDEIPTVSGFFSLELKSSAEVSTIWNHSPQVFPKPLAEFLGISRISSADTSFAWTNCSGFMPMVTGGQKPVFADKGETLRALASPDFTPRAVVYLPPEARGSVDVTNQTDVTIKLKEISAEKIICEAQSSSPAMLVIAQAFYEPWHVYMDDKRVPLWKANGAFQALEIPAGKHEVRVVYEDAAFKTGAMISLASLFAAGLCWVGAGSRRKS